MPLTGVVPFPPEFAKRYRKMVGGDFPVSTLGKVSKKALSEMAAKQ
jgi:hypothetical protein